MPLRVVVARDFPLVRADMPSILGVLSIVEVEVVVVVSTMAVLALAFCKDCISLSIDSIFS